MIKIRILFIFLCSFSVLGLRAQTLKNAIGKSTGGAPQKSGASLSLDSLRKREESQSMTASDWSRAHLKRNGNGF